MFMLIDDAHEQFVYQTQNINKDETRYYYISKAPYLAIIVCRDGLQLSGLANLVVDATAGNDRGYPDFCVPGYERRMHGKLTIFRIVDEPHTTTLTTFLHNSYQR